jgi:hypothetical protein
MTGSYIEPYTSESREVWDEFVRSSRNGSFILTRPYMDYHGDRLVDASLLYRAVDDELFAVLPAHRVGDALVSHGGLTYGGLLLGNRVKQGAVDCFFTKLLEYARGEGVDRIIYTPAPWIYHRSPVQADLFALYANQATIVRRQLSTVVNMEEVPNPSSRRLRGVRKATRSGVVVGESIDWAGFWSILSERLAERHDAQPVHDLGEIQLLMNRFPESILLFDARLREEQVAGAVVYESDRVARIQYMAANDLGRETGALDLLLHWLISDIYSDKPYVDLGSSHAPATNEVNHGLLEFKEGFGGRTIVQDTYLMETHA